MLVTWTRFRSPPLAFPIRAAQPQIPSECRSFPPPSHNLFSRLLVIVYLHGLHLRICVRRDLVQNGLTGSNDGFIPPTWALVAGAVS